MENDKRGFGAAVPGRRRIKRLIYFHTGMRSKIYRRNVGAHLCVRPQGGHAGPPLQKLSIER